MEFITPKINSVSAVKWEGVKTLVVGLEMLNAEGFAFDLTKLLAATLKGRTFRAKEHLGPQAAPE